MSEPNHLIVNLRICLVWQHAKDTRFHEGENVFAEKSFTTSHIHYRRLTSFDHSLLIFRYFKKNWKMTCIINHFLQFLCRNAVAATAASFLFPCVFSFQYSQIEANRNNNSRKILHTRSSMFYFCVLIIYFIRRTIEWRVYFGQYLCVSLSLCVCVCVCE